MATQTPTQTEPKTTLRSQAIAINSRLTKGEITDAQARFEVYGLAIEYVRSKDHDLSPEVDRALLDSIVGQANRSVWTWDRMTNSELGALVNHAAKQAKRTEAQKVNSDARKLKQFGHAMATAGPVTSDELHASINASWEAVAYVEDRDPNDEDRRPQSAFGKFAAAATHFSIPMVMAVGRGSEDRVAALRLALLGTPSRTYALLEAGDISIEDFHLVWPQYRHVDRPSILKALDGLMDDGHLDSFYEVSLTVAKALTHRTQYLTGVGAAHRELKAAAKAQYDPRRLAVRISADQAQVAKHTLAARNIADIADSWISGDLSEDDAAKIFPHLWWLPGNDFEAVITAESYTTRAWSRSMEAGLARTDSATPALPAAYVKDVAFEYERIELQERIESQTLDLDRLRVARQTDSRRRRSTVTPEGAADALTLAA